MLKKTIRRLGALAMVLAMAVSVFAVNASATTEGYTEIGAFTKKVTTDGHTYAPNTTFSYNVEGADAGKATVKATDNSTTEIEYYAGQDGDLKFTDTTFTPGTTVSGEYTVDGKIELKNNAYGSAGIYHYTVQEKNTPAYDGIVYDTALRHVFVYVVNGDNGREVASILITDADFNKQDGVFVNNYGEGNNDSTHDVTIKKTLFGNMANAAKDFHFDVKVTSADGAKEKYKVVVVNGNGTTATDPLVVSDDGVATATYTLKGGEYVTIYGLSTNDTIEVTEQEANQDGYTTQVNYTSVVDNKVTADNAEIEVVNTKNNVSPTGVIMTIAPYALMVVLAGAFAVVFLTRRNRAE